MNQKMIGAAQNGDEEAVKELFTALYVPLKKICFKQLQLRLKQHRKDALHDSLLVILKKLDGFVFKTPGQFKAWCNKITWNCCQRYKEKDKVMETWAPEDLPEEEAREETNSSIAFSEILQVFNRLPEAYRKNARMFFVEGHKHEDIGKKLQIATSTSRSNIARVRPVLQNWLIKLGLYER